MGRQGWDRTRARRVTVGGLVVALLAGILGQIYVSPAVAANNASIGDRVWNDVDGDGQQDVGELGMGSVTVTLLGAGRDGLFGTNDDKTFTPQATSATGTYLFTALAAGTYRVTSTAPTAFAATTTVPHVVTLASGQAYTAADIGLRQTNAAIGDLVFSDLDGDGVQDAGEYGVGGTSLTLRRDGAVQATTSTDSYGAYSFSNLAAGSYQVAVTAPPGTLVTTASTFDVTLTAGQLHSAADFGLRWTNGSIGDLVFEDEDGDGIRDVGEPGVAGVVLELRQGGQPVATTTTAGSGAYRFDGLLNGSYQVFLTSPVNFAATNGNPRTVNVAPGGVYLNVDFGVRQSNATIGDFVFDDRNVNGVLDVGEPGLAGVTVTLKSGSTTIATSATDAEGDYSFTGLGAGTYTVSVTKAAYVPMTTSPATVTVAKGESYVAADFAMSDLTGPTLSLEQASLSTIAGSGADASVDGEGTGASFSEMGPMVLHGGHAYVATRTGIRKVHLASRSVGTLGTGSCGSGYLPSGLTTDGTYLYTVTSEWGCSGQVRKVHLVTGVTSLLTTITNARTAAFGPDGFLYVASLGGTYRVDPAAGTSTYVANFGGYSLAADATYLWATSITTCLSPCETEVKRLTLTDGTITTLSATNRIPGHTQLVSAGDYLYATSYGAHRLLRVSKADGSWAYVAGTGHSGYADGVGTEAWFSSVSGLASDGTRLYVADSGNRRLRVAVAAAPLPSAQQPAATTTLAIDPAEVSTAAGSGTAANVDGTGASASFADMGGSVVVGGFLYQATAGAVRKVELATRAVTTLTGSGTLGCMPSSVGTSVQLGLLRSLDSDGTYLYGVDGQTGSSGYCPGTIWRISLATGAASRLTSILNLQAATVGPDGFLYAVTNGEMYRVDRVTGASEYFAAAGGYGVAADATYLWSNELTGCLTPCITTLKRTRISDGTVTVMGASADMPGDTQLVSAGDYLYGTGYGRLSVTRFSKADGSWDVIAGTARPGVYPSTGRGHYDGTGPGAWFDDIRGLAVHGSTIWIADSGNHRLRKAVQGKLPTSAGGPTARERLGGECDCAQLPTGGRPVADPVDLSTGNFFETTTDLAVPGRGFALAMRRTYNSLAAHEDGPLGYGWTHSYRMLLADDPYQGAGVKVVRQETGSEMSFSWNGSGWTPPSRVLATLEQNGDGTWTYTRRSLERFVFDAAGRLIRQVDPNGSTTALSYDGSGRLTTITDPAARTFTLTWTGTRITRVADHTGRGASYAYDAAGNLTDVTDVGNGNTHFTYDDGHLLLTVRDPRGNTVTTNTYDSARRALTQKDGLNRLSQFSYRDDGVVAFTDPKGNVERRLYVDGLLQSETRGYGTSQAATVTYVYDPVSLGAVLVRDGNGHEWRKTFDAAGNVLTATDPLLHTTTMTYNSLGRPLTVTDAANVTTSYTYDAAGNVLTRSTPLVGTGQAQLTTYHRDDPAHPGDITSVTDPSGKTWSTQYDTFGNQVRTTDPLGNATTYGYDPLGRPTTSVSPRGNAAGGVPGEHTTTWTYNPFGHVTSVTDPLGHQTVTTYDPNGNMATTTDPQLRLTSFTYNAANELVTVTRPDTSTLGYDYDDAGNLRVQRDSAGRPTTYGYDALNRVVSSTDPLNRTTSFGYDAAGNRTTVTDAMSRVTTFAYDTADRLRTITYSDGATPNVSFGYDDVGRRLSMADGTGTTSYSWDSLSRLVSSTDGAGATVGYGYDLVGRVTSLAYPGAGTVARGYDDAGRLASVGDWLGNTTTFSWDADSNLVGWVSPNGTTEAVAFDRADRLASVDHRSPGGATFASFAYGRNGSGLLTSTTPAGVPQSPETYTYSALDQLETVNGGAYDHDAADNLIAMPNGTTLAYDVANQLQSATIGGQTTTYGWDANGNRTSVVPPTGPAVSLGWDQANRLVSWGPHAAYAYDGDGLRTSKTVSGTTRSFVWDAAGGLPLLLKDGADSYVYGPGGTPLERIAADGTVTWVHADQLGSVRALTDATGAVVGSFSWDAYGNPTGSTGTVSTPFGFAGEYRDAESGMVHLRARYYDPTTGQFLSVDPAFTETASRYGYVDGDPLNNVDPSGLMRDCGPDKFYDSRYDACIDREVAPPSFAAPDQAVRAERPPGRGGCTSMLCKILSLLGPPIPPSASGICVTGAEFAASRIAPVVSVPLNIVTAVSGFFAVFLGAYNPVGSAFEGSNSVQENGIPYY